MIFDIFESNSNNKKLKLFFSAAIYKISVDNLECQISP